MLVSTRQRVKLWTGQVDELNSHLPQVQLKHVGNNCGFTGHFLLVPTCVTVSEDMEAHILSLTDLN